MVYPAAPAETTLLDHVRLAVRAVRAGSKDVTFALRRLDAAAAERDGPVARALNLVARTLRGVEPDDGRWTDTVSNALVRAGGAFEQAHDHAGARALFELASELKPECATTALHTGRAARRAGDVEAARSHYARARDLDHEGRIARLARIGEAMVSRSGEQLSREIRDAVRSGDREAAGVGLEARATFRCETARCRDAIRDLCACALRYPDREDQARAAERVAMLLTEANDLDAAREALLLVHEIGTEEQRANARRHLHGVSVQLGDVLGMRRWSSSGATPLFTRVGAAAALAATAPRSPRRALPVIRDWRNAVERGAGTS